MTRRVSVWASLLAIASMLALPAGIAAPRPVLAADPDVISSVDFDDGTTGRARGDPRSGSTYADLPSGSSFLVVDSSM